MSFTLLSARKARPSIASGVRDTSRAVDDIHVRSFGVSAASRTPITVLIGSNGTGKSRLLAGVAQAFSILDGLLNQKVYTGRNFPLDELEYEINGRRTQVLAESGKVRTAVCNGQEVMPFELHLPKRVIALTTTPYDKFIVPRRSIYMPYAGIDNVYQYLGLRDSTNKASPLNFLYTALQNLFDVVQRQGGRRDQIATVFDMLDLEPEVRVTYRLRSPKYLNEAIRSGPNFLDEVKGDYERRRFESVLSVPGGGYEQLRQAMQYVLETADARGNVFVEASLLETARDYSNLGMLQLLRRVGVLSVKSVFMRRKGGDLLDIRLASSGELSFISTFIALASVLESDSLVLIDEPEVSLHPEWQSRYIETLSNVFSGYTGCHYIVATHSPLIVNDIDPSAFVYSFDRDILVGGREVSGQPVDTILAKLFKLPTTSNLYLRNEVASALRLAADGEIGSPEFQDTVDELEALSEDIEADEPILEVIEALMTARGLGRAD